MDFSDFKHCVQCFVRDSVAILWGTDNVTAERAASIWLQVTVWFGELNWLTL
jgi:hypothetical protein